MPFFHNFYPKIASNAHFNSVLSNIGLFNRKTINAARFSIILIRISNKFYAVKIKTDFRNMCRTYGVQTGKTELNSLNVPTLPPFFFKKSLYLLKNEKRLSIFHCKNKYTYKFYVITIKTALGNMSESGEFKFENSLKKFKKLV